MVLTEAMIEEIKKGAMQVEYGKVVIEIEARGNESSVDIVTTARRRFEKGQPMPAVPAGRPGNK
jgi:predicted GNAT family N-acyltransferase